MNWKSASSSYFPLGTEAVDIIKNNSKVWYWFIKTIPWSLSLATVVVIRKKG